MNRSRITGDLVSQNNIFVDIANDRVGIGSTIPGQKLSLPDSAAISLGNSADLRISFDVSNSIIRDHTGAGSMRIANNNQWIQIEPNFGQFAAIFKPAEQILFHSNALKFQTTAYGVDVTGTTGTDGLVVSGVTTMSGDLTISSSFPRLKLTDTNNNSDFSVDNGNGTFRVRDVTNGDNRFTIDSTGQVDFSGNVDCNSGLDVTGNITGTGSLSITSAAPEIFLTDSNANSDYSIVVNGGQFRVRDETNSTNRLAVNSDGHVDIYGRLDAVGGFLASANSTIEGDLTLTDTTADSAAGPEFKLFRNSASPADADYLGQIKFAGESDTGVERNYAKITGKILDASNGTEDGIIEFAHIKAGSQTITGRWRSDSLQLLNGTALTVAGSTTVTGNIIPSSDSATDIGTNSVRFANLYADTLYGDGSNLTGVTSVGGNTGVDFNDSVKARFGTGNDLEIFHDGSHTYIENNSSGGGLRFIQQGSSSIIFRANVGGGDITQQVGWDIDGSGNWVPNMDSMQQIGYTSKRPNKIYADNFYGDGSNLTGIDTDLVGDTSPQLGGNLASNNQNILLPDSTGTNRIKFGTNEDLQIYHNGNNSKTYIGNKTSTDLLIENAGTNTDIVDDTGHYRARFIKDGAVELYHDNSKKLETASHGVSIAGNLDFPDNTSGNASLRFGNSQDFFMNHNGSDSYIINNTGDLYIRDLNGDVHIQGKDNEESIIAKADGAVELYHDNSKKLHTTSAGVLVSGNVYVNDSNKFIAGTHNDLQIFHDGNNSKISHVGSGGLYIGADTFGLQKGDHSENYISMAANGAVELFYDNARKFRTVSDGCEITSAESGDACLALIADEGDDNADYFRLKTANSGGFYLQNYAAGSWENNIKAVGNGAVELYHDNEKRFETLASGAKFSECNYIDLLAKEGQEAAIYVFADQGDDNADKWRIRANTSGNYYLENKASGSWETNYKATGDGAIELYYDNVQQLKTNANAVYIQTDSSIGRLRLADTSGNIAYQITGYDAGSAGTGGRLVIQDADGGMVLDSRVSGGNMFLYNNIKLNGNAASDNLKLIFGAGSDFELYHDGNYNILKGTGAHSTQFWTSNTARWRIQSTGHLMPEASASYSVGTSSYRVGTFYGGYISALINESSVQTIAEFRNQHSTYGGGVRVRSNNTYGELQLTNYDNSASGSFYNSTGGWHWSSNMQFHGAVSPWTDSSHDLGTSAKRWRTAYLDTLNVSAYGNNTSGTVANFRGGTYNQINIAHANSSGWGMLLTNTDQATYGSNAGYHYSTNTSVNSPCAVVNVNSDALHFATGNTSRWYITHGGNFLPYSNNSVDIGSTSNRVRDIYTNDLNLSNEGSSNDVDGTWGSYTIQEGEDDLFLINRRNGKKYKFNLTEVS